MSTLINLIENLELTSYGTSSTTNSQNKVVLIKAQGFFSIYDVKMSPLCYAEKQTRHNKDS